MVQTGTLTDTTRHDMRRSFAAFGVLCLRLPHIHRMHCKHSRREQLAHECLRYTLVCTLPGSRSLSYNCRKLYRPRGGEKGCPGTTRTWAMCPSPLSSYAERGLTKQSGAAVAFVMLYRCLAVWDYW